MMGAHLKRFAEGIILVCFEILAITFLLARLTSVNIKVTAVVCVVLGIMFIFLNKAANITDLVKKLVRKMSVKKMIVFIVLIGLITKLVSLFLFQIDSSKHEDCGMYWSFIQQLTNSGIITENADYASTYTYTVIFSSFFIPFTKVFGVSSILITSVYLCLLFTGASVLLFDTVKYQYGKNYAFAAVMTWILIPVGMWEPLMLVHENAFVVLHIIAIWLFFRVLPATKKLYLKALCFLLIALVISYAAIINQFGLISMIAMVIVIIIKLLSERISLLNIAKVLAVILAFSLLYIGFGSVKTAYVNSVVDEPSQNIESRYVSPKGYSIPYAWGFFVGMNYETGGVWNKEDAFTYDSYKSMESKEEARSYQTELIKKRVNDYLSNPLKLIKHIHHKFEIISNDFNPVLKNYGNSINNYFCTSKISFIYNILSAFIRILISFLVVFSFKLSKRDENSFNNYLKLFMLGTCIILMFTEVSTKYPSHLLFVYLTIAVINIKDTSSNIISIKNKISGAFQKGKQRSLIKENND